MIQLEDVFHKLRAQGKTAFMPYITGGDPDPATSWHLLEILAEQGADIVELGVPFTDALADGRDNQKAAMRALRRPLGLVDILKMAEKARRQLGLPVVLFSYYNSLHSLGLARAGLACKRAGLAGIVVPDLPFEESGPLRKELDGSGVELIQFVSPATPAARRRRIVSGAEGFIYYVSVTGVTGRRSSLAAGLGRQVAKLREASGLPIAVGFGISSPAHASKVASFADGVIVGSALVSLVERYGKGEKLYRAFGSLAGKLARAVHSGRQS
jgi:tryptophan synthase alpha chain